MSSHKISEWLLSHSSQQTEAETRAFKRKLSGRAKTISITSGKGGVGKTSASLKTAKLLSENGYRVLLIDCDTNLSNTAVKLGLPLSDGFISLISAQKNLDDVLYKDGNFHLLSACNGHMELFERGLEFDKLVIDIIVSHELEYDFILLDSPAGLIKESLTLSAYCDYRFIIVTPDKSSITDGYSVMKILNLKYGVRENHLLLNKISSNNQYGRLVKTLSETVENFLGSRLQILGGIPFEHTPVDLFDQHLLKIADSKIHNSFYKVVKKFTEEDIGTSLSWDFDEVTYQKSPLIEQEVQIQLS